MTKKVLPTLVISLLFSSSYCVAQNAFTNVDVGPGWAGADATANGIIWQFTDTESKVKNGTSFGRGLAIGVGRNGITLSHSIGANGRGLGVGHNLNLTIGAKGTHLSHGGVNTRGDNSRVVIGGESGQDLTGIFGGSRATGYGYKTRAYSRSHGRRFMRRFLFQ